MCLTVYAAPRDGDIRLVTGDTETFIFGRVEVYYKGKWGTVCDDNWGMNDANVVCHQLGYSGALFAPVSAAFGAGKGPIYYDEMNCNGRESRLVDCHHHGIEAHNCQHKEDAGVVCKGMLGQRNRVAEKKAKFIGILYLLLELIYS